MRTFRVSCFEISIEFNFQIQYAGFPPFPFTPSWYTRRRVIALLKRGEYIEAIKWVRTHTRKSLMQSKEYVDQIRDEEGCP